MNTRLFCSLVWCLTISAMAWAQPVGTQWRVWMKTSPCAANRPDFVTVLDGYPTPNGPNHYVYYPGSGLHATRAEAIAEKTALQASSPYYPQYCCTNYSVWENTETRRLSVVTDQHGSAGPPYRQVKARLCCEDAFALAGFPPSCGLPSDTGGNQPQVCDWFVYRNRVTGAFTLLSGMQNRPGAEFEPVINGQNLCCADAAALAGFPASFCIGRSGAVRASSGMAMTGTRLTYYGGTTARQCQADCARNGKCKGFTFIEAGTYSPGDPAMCYLLSDVTGRTTAKGHTSGMRDGSPIPTGPTGPVGTTPVPPGRPPVPGGQTGRWTLVSVSVEPPTPPNGPYGTWTYSAQSSSAHLAYRNGTAADFQWSVPPRQIDASGFNFNISAQSPKFETSMNASGIEFQGEGLNLEAGPVHAPSSQTKSGIFKPSFGSGEVELKVSMAYGAVTFHYKYNRTQ
jgi:hypothetical protein